MKLPTSSHNTLTSRSISVSPAHKLNSLRHGRIISCCVCKEDLKGQTVAVVGLGVSGRSAAKLALTRGASVIAIDSNKNLVPLERDSAFEKHGYLKTVLGSCDRELLESADRVVVSPGVPIENYGISSLLQSGRRVMSELDFAAEVLPKCIKILAVTGTNGKSTVSTFAGQMLCQLGIKAFVGGNLGNPLSEAAIQCLASPSVNPEFQASRSGGGEQLSDGNTERAFLSLSKVAVFLNLTRDHLERHKTMENYAAIKSRIFSHMSFSKLAILPIGNQHLNKALKDYEDNCNVAWIGSFPGIKMDMERRIADFKHPSTGMISRLHLGTLKAIGSHNFYNAAVAAFSVHELDVEVDIDSIRSTIALLKPPPHRMQIVRKDAQGVTWVDDSKATNVEAAYTGILALKEQKSVVLLGGVAKVLNAEGDIGFEQLLEPLEYHRGIITFGSSGMMIQKTLQAAGLHIPCFRVTTLEEAVNYARRKATSGDTIVLCPGCASFDEFRNFEHRGKVFQELAFALP